MRKLPLKVLTTLAALSLLASCGGGGGGGGGSASNFQPTIEEAQVDGMSVDVHYLAPFTTLNSQVNGTIPGSATLQRKDDKIFAYIRLFAGGPKVWHPQNVYTGGRCPTLADDTNGDGFIDINEAEAVLGNILIPLDADISSQRAGRNFFPLGDLSGSYFYERITSFNRFLSDLQSADTTPEDNIVKLGANEGLVIEGRVVLIQGVANTVILPETVGSKARYRAFQTLPIACGVFSKVTAMPGAPDNGQIPGPVAPVEDGQEQPLPDSEIPTNGTGGTVSGGTNDADSGDTPTSNGGVHTDYGDDD